MKKEKQISCHSRVFLSGISTLYPSPVAAEGRGFTFTCHSKLDLESSTQAVTKQPQQALKILSQVQDDTLFRKGFTLVELLIAVIIIGVLVAVAVPQYQKTVLHSRTVEAIMMLDWFSKEQDAWILENGGLPSGTRHITNYRSAASKESEFMKKLQPNKIVEGYATRNNWHYWCYCNASQCACTAIYCPRAPNNPAYCGRADKVTLIVQKNSATGHWSKTCKGNFKSIGDKICQSLEEQGWKRSPNY